MNGSSTQKIRTHHEILTRENEKLARQLNQRDRQQGQLNGKRVIVVQDDEPVEVVNFCKNFYRNKFNFVLLGTFTSESSNCQNLYK